MLRRRRPVMRAAMIGGTAYMAGKAGARAQQNAQQNEASEAEMAPAAPPNGGPTDIAAKLTELKGLLDQGALTPAEYETAKQKLLAG